MPFAASFAFLTFLYKIGPNTRVRTGAAAVGALAGTLLFRGASRLYALYATKPRPPVVAHVCDDIACRLARAEELCADLTRSFGEPGTPIGDGRSTWLRSPPASKT